MAEFGVHQAGCSGTGEGGAGLGAAVMHRRNVLDRRGVRARYITHRNGLACITGRYDQFSIDVLLKNIAG